MLSNYEWIRISIANFNLKENWFCSVISFENRNFFVLSLNHTQIRALPWIPQFSALLIRHHWCFLQNYTTNGLAYYLFLVSSINLFPLWEYKIKWSRIKCLCTSSVISDVATTLINISTNDTAGQNRLHCTLNGKFVVLMMSGCLSYG